MRPIETLLRFLCIWVIHRSICICAFELFNPSCSRQKVRNAWRDTDWRMRLIVSPQSDEVTKRSVTPVLRYTRTSNSLILLNLSYLNLSYTYSIPIFSWICTCFEDLCKTNLGNLVAILYIKNRSRTFISSLIVPQITCNRDIHWLKKRARFLRFALK